MKLWVDALRSAPEGYIGVKSVNEAISWIVASDQQVSKAIELANSDLLSRGYRSRSDFLEQAERWGISLIDVDHDAGDYAWDGGDYIKLLDWLEETGRSYPIRIHSMNPVGCENMRRIIRRNKWKQIY